MVGTEREPRRWPLCAQAQRQGGTAAVIDHFRKLGKVGGKVGGKASAEATGGHGPWWARNVVGAGRNAWVAFGHMPLGPNSARGRGGGSRLVRVGAGRAEGMVDGRLGVRLGGEAGGRAVRGRAGPARAARGCGGCGRRVGARRETEGLGNGALGVPVWWGAGPRRPKGKSGEWRGVSTHVWCWLRTGAVLVCRTATGGRRPVGPPTGVHGQAR